MICSNTYFVFCPKIADIKFMSGHKDIANYGDIYDKLETVYQRDGGQCTVDSAFGNVNLEFFIKLSQEMIHIRSYCAQSVTCDASLIRQLAEWGMRAFSHQCHALNIG